MSDTSATIAPTEEQTTHGSTGIAPLLVDGNEAARLNGISRATWDRLTSSGLNPKPLRLNGCVRWRVSDLQAWVELGCPPRDVFECFSEAQPTRRRS